MRRAGRARFARASPSAGARCRRRAVADPRTSPPARGPVAVGGFAFAPDGGARAALAGLRAGVADRVPEVALTRRRAPRRAERASDARGARASPTTSPRSCSRACSSGSASCAAAPLPLLDPAPTGRFQVASAMPPEHYEQAVARAVELIAGGRAREDRARARSAGARAARHTTRRRVFGVLREEFPSCFVLLRRARRRDADRRQPRAARAARGPAREHARARRLDAPQRRPRRRRPPRRAAAARRELPRGARDRRAADRAHAAPARRLGHRRAGAGAGADRQHPAPGDADPRAARRADRRARAGRPDAPHAGRRRRAARRRSAADPGARGPRPRLVRRARSAGPTPPATASSASPCAARCCAATSPAATPATASCATPTRARELAETEVKLQALLPLLAG